MIFTVDGKQYDTSRMRRMELPGLSRVTLYINEQERCAFVQTIDHLRGVVVKRATDQQLSFFARTYQRPELLGYLPLHEC